MTPNHTDPGASRRRGTAVHRPLHPRRSDTLRLALVSLATLGLIGSACGGGTKDDSAGPKDTGGNGSSLVNAADCPVKALDDAKSPVEITVWHAWLGKARKNLEDLADKFNKSQNKVVVHVESQGSGYEEMHKKYTDAMATPEALPDFILSQDTNTQFMIDSGTVIPAAACVAADPDTKAVYADFNPAVVSAYTVEGIMWPATFHVSQPVLYINRNHFKAAGLDPDNPPKTLAEVRAAAEAIMAAKANGAPELKTVERPMVLRLDSAWMENWVTGAGEEMVNNDNGRSGLATKAEMMGPKVKESFEWLKKMADDKLLNPIPFTNQFGQLFAMALQQSSILIETSTAITTVDAAIEGTLTNEDVGAENLGIDLSSVKVDTLDVGVGGNPGFEGEGRGQVGGAAGYLVDRGKPESLAAAWAFTKFLNEAPQQVAFTLEGSYLPIRKAARKDAALEKEFTSTRRGKWLAIAADAIDNLDAKHPGPVVGPYNEFRDIYRSALEKVTTQGAAVDEVLSESNTRFDEALAAYKKDVGG